MTNYNTKKLQNKFTLINKNKDQFVSLQEAIDYALTQSKKGLSQTNKNRFKNANTRAPIGKLNLQEYQRMAKMKRGIATVENLRSNIGKTKSNNKSKVTPGKLGNRSSFLTAAKPVTKTYNSVRNGAMIKKQFNKTIMNANKNRKAMLNSKRSKEVRKSPGKLGNRSSFLTAAKPVTKTYNSVRNGAMIKKQFNKTIMNANKNRKAMLNSKRSKEVRKSPGKLDANKFSFLTK